MANYASKSQRTAGGAVTVGTVGAPGASPRRVRIYELDFGSEGAVADNPFLWTFTRYTAAGTSTAITPRPLDPADAACVAVSGENHTVEPTYTANSELLEVPLNQRATYRWLAYPGGELVVPATANNGIGAKTPTAGAVNVTLTWHFSE